MQVLPGWAAFFFRVKLNIAEATMLVQRWYNVGTICCWISGDASFLGLEQLSTLPGGAELFWLLDRHRAGMRNQKEAK